jgi:hypothetical protein
MIPSITYDKLLAESHKTLITVSTEGTGSARPLQQWEFYAGFGVAQNFCGYSL